MTGRLGSQVEQVEAWTVIQEVVYMNDRCRVGALDNGIGRRLVAAWNAALFSEMEGDLMIETSMQTERNALNGTMNWLMRVATEDMSDRGVARQNRPKRFLV